MLWFGVRWRLHLGWLMIAGDRFDELMAQTATIYRRVSQSSDDIGGFVPDFEAAVTDHPCRLGEISGDDAVDIGKVARLATHTVYMRVPAGWDTIAGDLDGEQQNAFFAIDGQEYHVEHVEPKVARDAVHHLKCYVRQRDAERR